MSWRLHSALVPTWGLFLLLGSVTDWGWRWKPGAAVSILTVVPCFYPVGVSILFLAWPSIRKCFFPLKRAKFAAPLKASICLQQRVLRVDRVRRLRSPCPQVPQGALASCIIALTIPNCSFSVSIHACPHYWVVSSSKIGLCFTHFLWLQQDLLNGFPF